MNPSSELDKILDQVTWGDYQIDNDTWGYGIENRPEIKTQLLNYFEGVIGDSYEQATQQCNRDNLTASGADYMMDAIEAKLKDLGGSK